MARGVYIVGEDDVTRAIIARIIEDYAPGLKILQHLPARGSEIKNKISAFNEVAKSDPIILLADMDTEPCAPIAKNKLIQCLAELSPDFCINIAVDEAESWLLSDREGFSSYFRIPLEKMPIALPQRFMGPRPRMELNVPMKSSLFLTHYLISYSTHPILKEQIFSNKECKGKEYNPAILPFIAHAWSIENARKNSYSLNGMILRIQRLSDNH